MYSCRELLKNKQQILISIAHSLCHSQVHIIALYITIIYEWGTASDKLECIELCFQLDRGSIARSLSFSVSFATKLIQFQVEINEIVGKIGNWFDCTFRFAWCDNGREITEIHYKIIFTTHYVVRWRAFNQTKCGRREEERMRCCVLMIAFLGFFVYTTRQASKKLCNKFSSCCPSVSNYWRADNAILWREKFICW